VWLVVRNELSTIPAGSLLCKKSLVKLDVGWLEGEGTYGGAEWHYVSGRFLLI